MMAHTPYGYGWRNLGIGKIKMHSSSGRVNISEALHRLFSLLGKELDPGGVFSDCPLINTCCSGDWETA